MIANSRGSKHPHWRRFPEVRRTGDALGLHRPSRYSSKVEQQTQICGLRVRIPLSSQHNNNRKAWLLRSTRRPALRLF